MNNLESTAADGIGMAVTIIQDTAVKAATAHTVLDTDMPAMLKPEGLEIVGIEHLGYGRARFRGNYSTRVLAEFINYSQRRSAHVDTVQVFVDAERSRAQAFFNLGDVSNPGHGDDVAALTLQHTAPQTSLLQIADKPQSQKALAEWLEDWGDIISPTATLQPGEASTQTLASAIAAVRDITIAARSESNHTQQNFGASRTALEEIEAKSKATLPAGFTFICSPYEGFEPRTWNLRLSVLTEGDKPKLVLRIVGRQDVEEKIAQEFEQKVRDGLVDCVVFRGCFTP